MRKLGEHNTADTNRNGYGMRCLIASYLDWMCGSASVYSHNLPYVYILDSHFERTVGYICYRNRMS